MVHTIRPIWVFVFAFLYIFSKCLRVRGSLTSCGIFGNFLCPLQFVKLTYRTTLPQDNLSLCGKNLPSGNNLLQTNISSRQINTPNICRPEKSRKNNFSSQIFYKFFRSKPIVFYEFLGLNDLQNFYEATPLSWPGFLQQSKNFCKQHRPVPFRHFLASDTPLI